MATPVCRLTRAKIDRPLSSPGPRNDSPLVRLALSKEHLKANGTLRRSLISLRWWAMRSTESSDSMMSGPAIRNSRRPGPTFSPQSSIIRLGSDFRRICALDTGELRSLDGPDDLGPYPCVAVFRCRANEPREERVGRKRLAFEFRMKLASDKMGMVLQLDHLHQVQFGVVAAENQAR